MPLSVRGPGSFSARGSLIFIDLSNNNAEVDFKALAKAGVKGVWLKATEGDFFVDKTFAARRKAANAAGIRVGAYHFARPDRATIGTTEARFFAKTVGKIGRKDLRPVLDMERVSGHGGDEEWIRSWNRTVKNLLGVGPLFYSYPGLIPELHLSEPVGYGLWLADYGPNDGRQHFSLIPKPWQKIVAHQFTSVGEVAGVKPLDLTSVPKLGAVLAHPVLGRVG